MRLRSTLSLVLASSLVACSSATSAPEAPSPSPTPAPAAPAAMRAATTDGRTLRVGDVVSAVLTSEDPSWGSHGPFHLYRFRANEGDRLELRMASDEFDTYLVVGDERGGIFNPVMQDDDSGGNLDARVRLEVPATGEYVVIAQSYSDYSVGAYTISLADWPEPTPAVPVAITVGEPIYGELSDGDALDEWEERYHDVYTFRGTPGQRYAIEMSSADFDTYLSLGTGMGENYLELRSNDDNGTTTDSRILFTPDVADTYVIRASAFYGMSVGNYVVSLDEVAPPEPLSVSPIAFGRVVNGSIAEDDAMGVDGANFDAFTFTGREGQRIRITMRSDMVDSYLELGDATTEYEFYPEYSDDDSGGELDAEIVATLWRNGEYQIRAMSLFGGETGLYTLLVEELPPPGPPSVRAIETGQTVDGTLDVTDAMESEQHYDVYTFRGAAGQRVRITLSSDDFDPYLRFGRWDGQNIDVSNTDDDGGDGLDSQLVLTLPGAGTYAIQATSFAPGATGAYSVTLE